MQPVNELDPDAVAARLAELRSVYVAERVGEAHHRLVCEQPPSAEPLVRRVARSLAELRALCELAKHLRQR